MNFKKLIPYAVAIVIFVIASLAYFSPVLQGKKIQQSDITQFIGSSKEIVDYRKQHDEEPYWTNTSFGGMPSYVVSTYYPNDFIKKLDSAIRFLPRPADYLFLCFASFFVLLLVLKVDWKLAIIGALGFGFSTYFISLYAAGHNAKAHAIGYMPLVLSGILLVFQRKYLWGFVVTALAMSLELMASHIQMTYYLMFAVIILGIVQFIEAFKKKELPEFFKSIGILVVAVIIAVGTNATSLMATQEYANESTRSQSELTINPDGSEKEKTSGLSTEYITEYSYGQWETFSLFIPRFVGGTNGERVNDSQLREFLQDAVNKGLNPGDANYLMQVSSMYWGKMPFVAAPYYIGAIFIFLFVLGLFLVKGKYKYWLLAATIFSILLSWGKHFGFLTDFFINYVPLYNKFRAVASIQVIAELCIPLLGILGVKELLADNLSKEEKLKGLKLTTFIVVGLALLFVVLGTSLFSFVTPIDEQIDAQVAGFLDAIVADRQSLFNGDAIRTLVFVAILAGLIWIFIQNKIKELVFVAILGVLIVSDLVKVDKRYVNDAHFTSARKVNKPFNASAIDKEILKDKGTYRVANLNRNPMADGVTPYFHKSIGGYHAAKPRRYQELYDFHMANGNQEVFNMLNVKYFISSDDTGKEILEQSDAAYGNAWFVNKIELVDIANEEIKALDSLNTREIAIVNSAQFPNVVDGRDLRFSKDSLATIQLTDYKPNYLKYNSKTNLEAFAVFSEMYYKNGWNAYIDGKLVEHIRTNYILRGLFVPLGEHTIEFKFEPTVIRKGNTITLVSYALLLIIPFGWFMIEKRKKNVQETTQETV